MLGLWLTQPACLMRYMYKSDFLLAYYILQLVPDISLSCVAKFSEDLISNAADLFCVSRGEWGSER